MADPRFDIFLDVSGSVVEGENQLLSFGTGEEQFSRGFYKGAIMWLKCLITTQGTDLSDLSYGTAFSAAIGGSIRDIQDVEDLAFLAVSDTTTKIQEYQNEAGASSAERIVGAEIVDVAALSADAFTITIRLINATGDRLLLRLPLDVTGTLS